MSDFVLSGRATFDGSDAVAGLGRLNDEVAETQVNLRLAKGETMAAAAAFNAMTRAGSGSVAEINQLRGALKGAQLAENEAAAAARAAAAAFSNQQQAAGRATVSLGQMRAASTNLGQQIGDISQGLALGVAPMTIFAQQGGQVAYAMSGMGGTIGAAARFLSGPWGAVLTGAALILTPFIGKLFEADEAARVAADGTLTFAKEIEVALKPLATQAKEAFGSLADEFGVAIDAMRAKLPEMSGVIGGALRLIDSINNRAAEATGGGYARSNLAGQYQTDRNKSAAFQRSLATENQLNAGPLGGAFVDAVGEKAGRAYQDMLSDVAIGTGAVAEATRAYKDAEEELEYKVNAGIMTLAAARAELTRRRAAVDDAREATQKATAADREAERAMKAAAKAAEDLAKRQKIALADLFTGAQANVARIGTSGLPARNDLLDQAVAAIDAGQKSGDAFSDRVLTQAVAIGQAIGGSAGRAMQTIAGLAQGASTGNYTGVGGALGGALTLLSGDKKAGERPTAFAEGLKTAISAPLDSLKTTFKGIFDTDSGRKFAGLAGRAAGGAAVGGAVAGIGNAIGVKLDRTGASVGGAVGGALGPALSKIGGALGMLGPFAGILGGIAGGLIGGLFSPKGSTTISASGGKISSAGTGNAAVQKATGAIGNTVTDALQSIAEQLGGEIGDFSVSIGKKKGQFRVDRSGTGKLNGGTVTGTDDEGEALTLAIADALKDGAIKSSPRVQAALLAYADNVNKAVTEALKVKNLEDLLADRNNPFLGAFRALESQLKQRVDVARQYGFDLVEIEKVNAKDRAAALQDTLARATGSIRALLTDLTIGSGATGSATQRLAGLTSERDRLVGLANAGDTTQGDAIADIIRKIDDLSRETYGSTAGFASGRADNISILGDLMRQTEDRAKAAADQARGVAEATVAKLSELNATGDDQFAVQVRMAASMASIDAQLASGALAGGGGFGLANLYARER